MAITDKQRERQKAAAAYFRKVIGGTQAPRNQIASLSGLSNTYICHLEKGHIANASRDKLVAFGVGVGLDLGEIDKLLVVFGLPALSREDIPLFIAYPGRRKISKAMLPLHDWYSYELHIMIVERTRGSLIIVNDRPTAALTPEGFRSYVDRKLLKSHPIYGDLIEAVGRERTGNLTRKLADSTVEHYICRRCLEEYVRGCDDPVESVWRRKHVEQLIWYVANFKNFRLFVCDSCSRFTFTVSIPRDAADGAEKLLFMGRAPHGSPRDGLDHIAGFTTENQLVVANFKEGLEAIRSKVIPGLKNREKLLRYLRELAKEKE